MMNHQDAWERLQDHLDGALSPDEERRLEAHLETCPICRGELAALRRLVAAASELPREIPPPRDLWSGIAPRLAQRATRTHAPESSWDRLRASWRGLWPVMVGTAAVLVIVIASTVERAAQVPPDPAATFAAQNEVAGGAGADAPGRAVVAALEAESEQADIVFEHFAAHVADDPDGHSGTVFTTIQQNLQIIEHAIAEARQAWEANPGSPRLIRLLAAAYQAKSSLQERATELVARS